MSNLIKKANARVFCAKRQIRGLNNRHISVDLENREVEIHLLFNDIVQCACFPIRERSIKHLQIINQSLPLFIQYKWVLDKIQISTSAQQAAASSESTEFVRRTDCFSLTVTSSASEDEPLSEGVNVTFTLLQKAKVDESKAIFLHVTDQNKCYVLPIPRLDNSQTTILMEKNADIVSSLMSLSSEICLTQ